MKQFALKTLLFCMTVSASTEIFAQQYRWLTGGGSRDNLQNGAISGEWVTHILTDDNGNVYTLARVGDYNIKADTFFLSRSFNATAHESWNIIFTKHDCNGNMRFAKLFECSNTVLEMGIAYDKGKIYVSGLFLGDKHRIGYDATFTRLNHSYFLAKFDTTGMYEWTKFVGPDDLATALTLMGDRGAVAVDGQGNIHQYIPTREGLQITPSITSVWGNYDLKYDVNGNLLDVKFIQGVDSNYYVQKVEFDKATNKHYVLFEYAGGTTTRSGTILAAYNANGSLAWKDTTNPRAGFGKFRFNANDGIYFTALGYVQFGGFKSAGSSITGSAFSNGPITILGKIDHNDGKIKWMHEMGCSNALLGLGDIEVLPDKSLAAVGILGGTVVYNNVYSDTIVNAPGQGSNPFLVNIDSTGMLIDWNQMYGAGFSDNALAMASDKKGNVYFGGEVILDMQGGNLPKYTSNGGNSDYYISKYGYDCGCTSFVTPNTDFTFKIDTLAKKVSFDFTGTTTPDSLYWQTGDGQLYRKDTFTHTYADTGTYTICVKSQVACGRKKICKTIRIPSPVSVKEIAGMPGVSLYPNPANDVLYIEGAQQGVKAELYDMMGRKVYSGTINQQKEAIDVQQLPQGNYIIQLTDNTGKRWTGKVLKR